MSNKNNNVIHLTKNSYAMKAIYSDHNISEYRNNPLIEALPPILSVENVIAQLSVMPKYHEGERDLEPEDRFHMIQRLYRFFQPFEKHLDLEQRMSRVIRQGYLSRNPFSKGVAEQAYESYMAIKNGEFLKEYQTEIKKSAMGFTIIGISGIGKTTGVERVLSLYPQIIYHDKYGDEHINLYQLSWLKLDCPMDGSLKGLCVSFFSEIDRLLGTKYFSKFGTRSNTVDVMMQHMSHLSSLHAVGVLVIDEIQHLSLAKSGGSEKMLNFFVTLVNTIGIPVVLIGTYKAVSVLQSEFRQARRGSGAQGDMVWGQMPKDDMWDLLIEGMWKFQWTKKFTPITKELNELLYYESQGILDIAVKLFMIAQLRAISTGKEQINEKLIKQVAKDCLKLLKPMLDALKSGSISDIAKYEDIRPIDIEENFEQLKVAVDLNEKIRKQKIVEASLRNKKENSLLEEIILRLLQMSIEARLAKKFAQQVIETYGEEITVAEATKIAFTFILEYEGETKIDIVEKKQKRRKRVFGKSDLRSIVEDGFKKKQSGYEALVESGYVKGPVEEFFKEVI